MSVVLDYVSKSSFNALQLVIGTVAEFVPVVETIAGVGASILSLVTLGTSEGLNQASRLSKESIGILPRLYMRTVKVINPYSTFEYSRKPGILTRTIASPIYQKAWLFSFQENSFLKKHIFSRATFGLAIPVSVITRTADLALGAVAATFSIFPWVGSRPKINKFAMKQLTFLGVIDDVCLQLRGVVNPQQCNLQN